MQLRKLRPSPSLVVASVALAVATGGTSYAAMMINSADIQNDSIRSVDVKNETLRSADIRDGAITRDDMRPKAIPNETRWALVDAEGDIVAQSGGFTVVAAYPVLEPTGGASPLRANGNVYIDAGEDLSDNGITATIALQNTVDQNDDDVTGGRAPGADNNPEFSGEITVSQCGTPITACAPPGTGETDTLVVSPRLSNGSFTEDGNRKRFYVFVA